MFENRTIRELLGIVSNIISFIAYLMFQEENN